MAVLDCVKPGARAGQVVLAVDLSIAGNSDEVLASIQNLGYAPIVRHVAYPSGIHVLAFLRDEQHESMVDDDYLLDEWQRIQELIPADAVHLWRGK